MLSVQHVQLKQTFDTFQITFFDDKNFTVRQSLLKYMLKSVFDFTNLVYKSANTYKCDITVYVVDNFLGSDLTNSITVGDKTTSINNISVIENIISNTTIRS